MISFVSLLLISVFYTTFRFIKLKQNDVLDPFYKYMFFWLLSYSISMILIYTGDMQPRFLTMNMINNNLFIMYLVLLVSLISIISGDILGIRVFKRGSRRLTNFLNRFELRNEQKFIILFFIFNFTISLVGWIYIFSKFGFLAYIVNMDYVVSQIPGWLLYLLRLSFFSTFASLYLVIVYKRNIFYYIFLMLSLGLLLLNGSKSAMLGAFVMGLVIYNYKVKRVSFIKIASFAISMIFLFSIIRSLRSSGFNIESLNISFNFLASLSSFSFRFYGYETLLLLFEDFRFSSPFGEYLAFFDNFSLRSMNPDKPEAFGFQFAKLYSEYIDNSWDSRYVSIPPYELAGYYINGFLPFAFIMIFFISMLRVLVYKSFIKTNMNFLQILIYNSFLLSIVNVFFEGYLSVSLFKIFFNVTVFIFIYFCVILLYRIKI